MRQRWIFDLDGTLVDTCAANRAAYNLVGIDPPPDFHIRPWQEWCPQIHHDRKNSHLPKMLAQFGSVLPALKMLEAYGGHILTNASPRSYAAIVAVFPSIGQYGATVDVTPRQKLDWLLQEQGSEEAPGVYVDDNSFLVEEVRRLTRWQALDTSGF